MTSASLAAGKTGMIRAVPARNKPAATVVFETTGLDNEIRE